MAYNRLQTLPTLLLIFWYTFAIKFSNDNNLQYHMPIKHCSKFTHRIHYRNDTGKNPFAKFKLLGEMMLIIHKKLRNTCYITIT